MLGSFREPVAPHTYSARSEDGNLFIQLKRGTYGFSRMHEVNEYATIADFVDGMIRDLSSEDRWDRLPADWTSLVDTEVLETMFYMLG